MDQNDIETFLAIVETKSISKAAEVLFLAPTTVGARLKSLEEELGFPLIIRRKGQKEMELTQRGAYFISYAEQWQKLWQDLQVLKDKEESLQLKIGSITSLTTHLLTPLFTKFAEKNPSIDLKIQTLDTDVAYGLVQKRNIDMAFVLQELSFSDIETIHVISEPLVLVSTQDLQFPETIKNIDELPAKYELFVNWGPPYLNWYENKMNRIISPRFYVNTIPLLLDLFQKDGSWTIVSASIAKQLKKKKQAIISHFEIPPPERKGYLIVNTSPREEIKQTVLQFQDMMESHFD